MTEHHINKNWKKFMDKYIDEYVRFCKIPSDINEHLPLLYSLCVQCASTKEFGVGFGVSTRAFLAAITETKGRLDSYELNVKPEVASLFEMVKQDGLNAELHATDITKLEKNSNPADFLFIDSLHTYDQVRIELENHGDSTKKFIAFHDTQLFGVDGEIPGNPNKLQGHGILRAITQWMQPRQHWVIKYEFVNNNGLLVLENKDNL